MSHFVQYNPNPLHKRTGDCVIRAISKALDQDWNTTYLGVVIEGFYEKDMPSGNAIWGDYLKSKGFSRHAIPSDFAGKYTVADFARDNPEGTYLLAIDGHLVCVKDGSWFDTWDSQDEVPQFYWTKND